MSLSGKCTCHPERAVLAGVAVEEEEGVVGRVASVSSSGVVSRCAGFNRSSETLSLRPFRSRVNYLAAQSITLKGPS